MRKWTYLVAALLVGGATTTFTGCIDNDEPTGIEQLRGAKAEFIKAKAAYEDALTQIQLVKVEREKVKLEKDQVNLELKKCSLEVEQAKTELEKQIEERENNMDDLISQMAKIIIEENEPYIGKELKDKAIEKGDEDSTNEGGKADGNMKTTRGRKKSTV